jgi:ADP-ribose pyrophosphatase YjhB (NUDIX family)/GNAT superfamily N-acetyltransferase
MRAVADRIRPVCPACGFIFYLNPIVAAGSLIERDGRVALVRRGVEPGRGLWGLPAGYVEVDESAEEAAVRETWEEAHLRIEIDGLLDAFSYASAQNRGVLLIYAAHVLSGTLKAGDDAMDAGWFGPEELPEIAFRTHRQVLRQWRQARAVIYRPASSVDAEGVTTLVEAYPLEQDGEHAPPIGDPDRELFIAVDNGQVIGFCGIALDRQNRTAQIEQVFVHPRYRRWGVGTQLIATCLRHSEEAGIQAVHAQAPVSNPGWTVYLKAGFRVSGFTSDYYAPRSSVPEAALLLTCDLSPDRKSDRLT